MKKLLLYFSLILIITSCKKQDEWLDKKSNKADVVPSTLKDLQSLLDNNDIMNDGYGSIGIDGSDNSYVTEEIATTAESATERNAYIWAADIFEGETYGGDWDGCYKVVAYSNVVLEGLDKLLRTEQNKSDYDNIKGSALFYRAFAFYQLMQLFAVQYDPATAATALGIPLRLNSDVNLNIQRSTVQQSFDQIFSDLNTAVTLLPKTPLYKTRPSTTACQAMLAKAHLVTGNYLSALENANLVLESNDAFIDFNSLSLTADLPLPTFPQPNTEIIFYAKSRTSTIDNPNYMLVDPQLYGLYSINDLRKGILFRVTTDGTFMFKGLYTGGYSPYCGLGINEILLIKAECMARQGKFNDAVIAMNSLLVKRWTKDINGSSTYSPPSFSNETDALTFIFKERRKEMPVNGYQRWEDLRRLNKDSRFAKTLTRTVAGKTYTLEPNSPRYTYPIPPSEMNVRPLIQNIR